MLPANSAGQKRGEKREKKNLKKLKKKKEEKKGGGKKANEKQKREKYLDKTRYRISFHARTPVLNGLVSTSRWSRGMGKLAYVIMNAKRRINHLVQV